MELSAPPLRLHDFPGGLHLDYRKDLSTGQPIGRAPLPPQLILPLSQHIGGAAKPRVRAGDRVRRGQTLAEAQGAVSAALHAPTSGTIVAIERRAVPHPSGLMADCLVLAPDGEDRGLDAPEWTPVPDYQRLDGAEIRELARRAGVVGLGGAAFPAAIKLNPGRTVHTLIINGAECEPYISCDQMLMTEHAEEIVLGIQVVLHALQAPRCLIGIEDNKPTAIRALSDAARSDARIHVVVVPTRYPQGGEKQLILTLTGEEVPSEGLPLDIGIVCHNPATVRAIGRAVCHGEPLIERVVTVTGEALRHPQNLWVRLGTPVGFLIEQVGGYVQPPGRQLMGGPMMGFRLPSLDVPVVKATNCLLALPEDKTREAAAAQPCIRCGECATACPARLLPQQLYWHARAREYEQAEALNLFDCIECGCCALVCPSHIPLVQYYRHAKTEIWNAEAEKRAADAARLRHEARQARLEREERAKEEARARKKAALAASSTAPASTAPASVPPPPSAPTPSAAPSDNADDPVARALARAQARKAGGAVPAPAAVDTEVTAPAASAPASEDPVAKALAAAQARKAARNPAPAAAPVDSAAATTEDPVAQALAAAQARKAAKAAAAAVTTDGEASKTESEDPVARALAAAQARKAARNPAPAAAPVDSAAATTEDPVAQALAAAQARKAAKAAAAAVATDGEASKTESEDPVARALAAAQARKAARLAKTEGDAP